MEAFSERIDEWGRTEWKDALNVSRTVQGTQPGWKKMLEEKEAYLSTVFPKYDAHHDCHQAPAQGSDSSFFWFKELQASVLETTLGPRSLWVLCPPIMQKAIAGLPSFQEDGCTFCGLCPSREPNWHGLSPAFVMTTASSLVLCSLTTQGPSLVQPTQEAAMSRGLTHFLLPSHSFQLMPHSALPP